MKSRGSRTVLGARGGEIPPRNSTKPEFTAPQQQRPLHLNQRTLRQADIERRLSNLARARRVGCANASRSPLSRQQLLVGHGVLVAESEDDVVEGVRLARDRGWKVAIRAGGHSFPVWSVRDDALLIDLGGFKETALDESTGVVNVTPSVSSGELNGYLSGYGRFFSFGDGPSVGLGGFLLRGGMGLGFRGWGYAAEQIAAIDVVTRGRRHRPPPRHVPRSAWRL